MITPAEILEHYGDDHQIKKTIEELTEMSLALQHYQDGKATKKEVISELADVGIMLSQMRIVFGFEEVVKEKRVKLNRMQERLKYE